MPRVLGGSHGGGRFLMGDLPLWVSGRNFKEAVSEQTFEKHVVLVQIVKFMGFKPQFLGDASEFLFF